MPRSTSTSGDTEGDKEVTQEKQESKDAEFYCPGCGMRYNYQQQCSGKPESPHPPLEVVPTSELSGEDPTAAPDTTNLG